jgi:MFS transporter, SP family, arabinose:H+ symporter
MYRAFNSTIAGEAPRRQRSCLWIATLVSICGGFLFGYDNLVISGAIDYLSRYFGLDAPGVGWAASCAVIGCMIGSATAGWVVDALGAKFGLWLCAACFAGSSVGTGFLSRSLGEFTLWRMLAGLGIGTASIVAPMYIAEIAPTRVRGRLVTLYQFGIVLGILSAVFVNMLIQRMGDDAWNLETGWRWMFFAGIAPAAIFAAMIVPAVESPRWLMKMNRSDQAGRILCRLNGPEVAAIEARQIQQSLRQEEGKLRELFTTGFRRALVIGIMLAGLSQASGIFCLLSFLPEVFKAAGAQTGDAFFQTVLVGVVLAIFTLVALALVDIAGRKTLILIGTFMQFVSFAAVGWLYSVHGPGWAILFFVMVFVAAHAVGNGAVCWVVISEIFPTKVRGRAMSIATTSLMVVAFIGNLVYPLMREELGHSGSFWCFSGAALVNLLYAMFYVPETKGRSLEQIEDLWNTRGREAPVRAG